MRTKPAHIAPGCPWCNADHNPDIVCREQPESVRFHVPPPRAKVTREPVRITDPQGNLVAVKTVIREG